MPDEGVTYHHDAGPIFQRYCTSCHQPGGLGPFSLTTYDSAWPYASAIQGAVLAGTMPPWMPSDRGVPLLHERRMRPEDRDLLLRWIAAGTPEGDPQTPPRTDIPPPDPEVPVRADVTLDIGAPYKPDTSKPDDYRCFVLDPFALAKGHLSMGQAVGGDLFITAGEVRPDKKPIVHHVLVYEVPAALTARVRELDDQDAGPGYTCFGAPLQGQADETDVQTVLGWEGGPWIRPPAGTAIQVRQGSLLVMQMHYALTNYQGEQDRTTAVLELSDHPPERIAYTLPLSDPDHLHIPAGNPDASERFSVAAAQMQKAHPQLCGPAGPCQLEVFGNFPHMHLLGKSVVTRIQGGPVLVEIPRWNFHWQGGYQFRQSVSLGVGDSVEVECHYDNSAAAQPILDGQVRAPRDVGWGPGALDEMCLSYLFVVASR